MYFLPLAAHSQTGGGAAAELLLQSLVERLDNGDIRLGAVTVHRQPRSISFPAKVNMAEGHLEVLIATPRGRLHESLFSAAVQPMHLQTMLYLADLRNGARLPAQDTAQGSLVDIDVEWLRNGETVRLPIEHMVFDERNKRIMERAGWVFIGSRLRDGFFLAEEEGNLVLLWSVGSTILDTADPRAHEDDIFFVHTPNTPPEDTEVRIIITPRKKVTE